MIGSPFSLLVLTIFMVAILCVLFVVIGAAIRVIPEKVRKKLLYFSLLVAVIGSGTLFGGKFYFQEEIAGGTDPVTPLNIDSATPPYASIGRIIKNRGVVAPCSATLVAPDKALTAAQCLRSISSASGFTPPEQIYVQFPGKKVASVLSYKIGQEYKGKNIKMPDRIIDN